MPAHPHHPDLIKPVRITHEVDEIVDAQGRLEQSYNFLLYTFERDGWSVTARAYADEFHTVSIFPPQPLAGPEPLARDRGPLVQDVRTYLQRRFADTRSFPPRGGDHSA